MAIIDLNTGTIGAAGSTFRANPLDRIDAPRKKVIDLDTGEFVDSKLVSNPTELPPKEPDLMAQKRDRLLVDIESARSNNRAVELPKLLFELESIKTEMAQMPETKRQGRANELPELGQGGLLAGEDKAQIAAIAPILLTTTSVEEIAKILTSNFPNIGITQDAGGNFSAGNNQTGARVILNRDGLSQIDLMQGLGLAAAFFPASSVTGATIPALAKVGAQSAATQAGIESFQALAGGDFDPGDIALAGGAAVLGQSVSEKVIRPLARKVKSKFGGEASKQIADDFDAIAPSIAAGKEASEATGIPLFKAQQTTIPTQLRDQAFIQQLPAGTRKASDELRKQNDFAGKAVDDALLLIAPSNAVTSGPTTFRTAAQKTIDIAKQARSEAASPIYKQAFRRQRKGKLSSINTSSLTTKINKMSKQFDPKGQIGVNLEAAFNKISGAKGNLQKLHLAKIEIEQTINTIGENSVGNTTKRFLTDVVSDLTEELKSQSPSYKAAVSEFSRLSPEVQKISDSVIGRIAKTKDDQLKNISRRMFDPAETNIDTVLKSKKIINDADPEAWNLLLRSEMERRIGSVKADLSSPNMTLENIPGQLSKAIFGNTKQRDILLRSADADVRKNLLYLDTALKRASLGRGIGSETAARGEMAESLKKGFVTSLRDWITSPINTAGSIGEEAMFDRRVRVLAEAMFDPQWKPQMKDIKAVNPQESKAAVIMSQLLKDIDNDQENQK